MTKRKTKMVCVGWGVVMYLNEGTPYIYCAMAKDAETEEEAIKLFDEGETSKELKYKAMFKKGTAIAKKLWVEVKDD